MGAVSALAGALLTISSAEPGAILPDQAQLEGALNALETCRGLTGPDCPAPLRRYTVHGSKCMAISPEQGRRAVACRVDLTLTYADPQHETTRYHDTCLRLGEREDSSLRREWVVLQIRDRVCEMASAVTTDLNRTPTRAQLERALVGRARCYDPDEIFHCGPDPDIARVERYRCRPIPASDEAVARAACRITAVVGYSWRPWPTRLRNECVRLDRTTPADQSPAHWVAIHVPDGVPCELR